MFRPIARLLLPLLPFLCVASLVSAATYNVRDFGAAGDGVAKDTRAFQKALDVCAVNGGGDVLVPAGKYLIGSIQIGDRTVLRLDKDSVLLGSPDLADYPMCDVRWEGRWQVGRRGLIYASAVENIGIIGEGLIQGAEWGTNTPDGIRNPVVVEPISCNNVRWEGFTVRQGGHWATHPTYCTNVTIRNLTITGKRDGIDVDSCRNVWIEGCTIESGDDCISLKSGRGMDGARLGRACEDVVITGCTLTGGRFACLGIGSETSGGVRNVRIEHCKLKAATHTIYIKTRIGRAGVNENISGEDLEVLGGDFLRINLVKGGNNSTADDPVEGLAGYPTGRNFRFANIRLAGAKAVLVGTEISAVRPLDGLTLTNVTGTCSAGLTLANVRNVVLKDIAVTGYAGPLLGAVNVTGAGLEGAVAIPAPIDPPPGTARGTGR
jgi:polygalacturonase